MINTLRLLRYIIYLQTLLLENEIVESRKLIKYII